MSLILNIHTATETAIVNFCSDKEILATSVNYDSKQHASFLHTAINQLLKNSDRDIKEIDAIGVTAGPGSYTGIRVGLSAAKGLCYALKIPLITFNSLELLAWSTTRQVKEREGLYCPMIDARRMEIYTALYNYNLRELQPPAAIILNENSFSGILSSDKVFFSGNGSNKFKKLVNDTNAIFVDAQISTESLSEIAGKKFDQKEFENIPYAKPLYIKDFHTISKK